jgi:hypothetical protein
MPNGRVDFAYPSFARYTGKGSVEEAANFICVKPANH